MTVTIDVSVEMPVIELGQTYTVSPGTSHARSHVITSSDDHTSTATEGQLLKADANGLPVDATNTDAEVAAVVADATLNTADPTPDTDHTVEGRIHPGTAGESLTFGQLVYLKSDGKFWKTNASAEATAKGMLRVVASATIAGAATGNFAMPGAYIRDDSWSWTVGAPLFVYDDTAGGLAEAAPSDSGDIVRVAGYAQAAGIVFFNPSPDWYEVT